MLSFFGKAALNHIKTAAIDTTRITAGTAIVVGSFRLYDKFNPSIKNSFFEKSSNDPKKIENDSIEKLTPK
ncbi:hypothetical protein [Legionella brunensis]|uniref:Uncharacterized protein n=1 Tax=Legionella brunensis TaxID=29422 RepID=A0A0W0SK99_9GAMM|nr:hypothetical protein [Legionella brunensis]KTC83792.1 hypothetical protein Lbru_1615 [Legionella brunensis]